MPFFVKCASFSRSSSSHHSQPLNFLSDKAQWASYWSTVQERHAVEVRPRLALDPSALRKAVYKTTALLLPRKVVITREFLDFAPKLRAVARMHVGSENTDLEACRERQVRVIQTSTANVRSNTEFLLASLLALYLARHRYHSGR